MAIHISLLKSYLADYIVSNVTEDVKSGGRKNLRHSLDTTLKEIKPRQQENDIYAIYKVISRDIDGKKSELLKQLYVFVKLPSFLL
jgi:hypothetical protein